MAGPSERAMPAAMVLSAGLGTRLRPLTLHRAKPLVPVGDRPALAHVLPQLRASGVPRVVVNAHHLADQVAAFAGAQPWDVRVSEEVDLLGTAGGIAHARELLGAGDVLVWNGDILADVDVTALVTAHRAVASRMATLVVQPLAAGEGAVGLDPEGRVVRLRTSRFGQEARGGNFLGIQVVGEALRARMPSPGGLIEDVLVPALARGEVVGTLAFEGVWRDIGTLESYLAANVAWLQARRITSFVGPGATVGREVVLDHSVVGEGAEVLGTGAVTRCVVWPGARAVAPLVDQVVTS